METKDKTNIDGKKRGKPYIFLSTYVHERVNSNVSYQIEGKRENKKRMLEINTRDNDYCHKMKIC